MGEPTNSPAAKSNDVLVLLSSGTDGDDENHPPGKKREEVVDSCLLRVALAGGRSTPSSTEDSSWREGLERISWRV